MTRYRVTYIGGGYDEFSSPTPLAEFVRSAGQGWALFETVAFNCANVVSIVVMPEKPGFSSAVHEGCTI